MMACNIAAGWVTTSIQVHTLAGGTGTVTTQASSGEASVKTPLNSFEADPTGQDLPGYTHSITLPIRSGLSTSVGIGLDTSIHPSHR